jgi:hypothetical protein
MLKPGMVVLMISFLSCAGNDSLRCGRDNISDARIILIVDREMERRGGHPNHGKNSRIKIRREGCDYVYHELFLPAQPGSDLYVRISKDGEIIDFVPGL